MAANKFGKLARFVHVNGWYVTMLELMARLASKTRSGAYSRKFHSRKFQIGERPYIRGIEYMQVGNNFRAGKHLWMEAIKEYGGMIYDPKIVIGDNVGLSDAVHIAATTSVVVGDGVLVGSRVLIIDHNHGIYSGRGQTDPVSRPSDRPLSYGQKVLIGRNVWIGDGVVVLPGSSIGEGSVIGANSVVSGDIPSACIAVGSPARPVKSYDTQSKEWVKRRPSK